MKKIILFVIPCCLVFISGCHKLSDECEDTIMHRWLLPKVLNSYLPYEVGQRLAFSNEMCEPSGDTVIYEVTDVQLLDYDQAYVTYSVNPCYPTGAERAFSVSLKRISGQTGDDTPSQIDLYFVGTASGENGQCVNVAFGISSLFDNNRHSSIGSEWYQGDISDMGDRIQLSDTQYQDHFMAYAEIIKDRGLHGFNLHHSNSWMLIEGAPSK